MTRIPSATRGSAGETRCPNREDDRSRNGLHSVSRLFHVVELGLDPDDKQGPEEHFK